MAQSKKSSAVCPCCNTPRHRTETKEAVKQVKAKDQNTYTYYSELDTTPYDSLVVESLNWACDPCLATGNAVTANPSAQVCSQQPRLAYWSTEHTCRTCECSFLFQLTEQQYWYESLKFNLDSVPVNCPDCRKVVRRRKNENKELSDLLRDGEEGLSTTQLKRIIEIYSQWDMVDKAKYFSGILKRRKY